MEERVGVSELGSDLDPDPWKCYGSGKMMGILWIRIPNTVSKFKGTVSQDKLYPGSLLNIIKRFRDFFRFPDTVSALSWSEVSIIQ